MSWGGNHNAQLDWDMSGASQTDGGWHNGGASGGGKWTSGDDTAAADAFGDATNVAEGNNNNKGFNEHHDDGNDRGCFNCGETGHMKADCPNPRANDDRGCFNCGEPGHMKSECPNPAVEREFTGQCRLCEKEGHRAKDCPEKSPMICNNCDAEGHIAADCKAPRKVDRSHLEDVSSDTAWARIKQATSDKDVDEVKLAIQLYVKANPAITYSELEQAFRNQDIGVHLIAVEKPSLLATLTLMDLQGICDKKFTVAYRFSDKPARPRERALFPKSPQENIERLAEAGEPIDSGKSRCHNCQVVGHTSRNCPEEKMEKEQVAIKCLNCDQVGHRLRDCPEERASKHSASDVECRKCNQVGHFAKDCPEGGGGSDGCRKCGESGHFARECSQGSDTRDCRKCGEGHIAKDCTQGGGSRACFKCGQEGHMARDCDQEGAPGKDADQAFSDHGNASAQADMLQDSAWESAAPAAQGPARTQQTSIAAAW